MSTATTRQTAAERREAVLDAATKEFAAKGLHGASTDDIARAAGISQPYLFRLFRTKKELYLAAAERCVADLNEIFSGAAEGLTGREALEAMGTAYEQRMLHDRDRLLLMLKSWASADDPEICEVSRKSWRGVTEIACRVSGEPPEVVADFFAHGMLLTIFMAIQLFERPEPWAEELIRCSSSALGKSR